MAAAGDGAGSVVKLWCIQSGGLLRCFDHTLHSFGGVYASTDEGAIGGCAVRGTARHKPRIQSLGDQDAVRVLTLVAARDPSNDSPGITVVMLTTRFR